MLQGLSPQEGSVPTILATKNRRKKGDLTPPSFLLLFVANIISLGPTVSPLPSHVNTASVVALGGNVADVKDALRNQLRDVPNVATSQQPLFRFALQFRFHKQKLKIHFRSLCHFTSLLLHYLAVKWGQIPEDARFSRFLRDPIKLQGSPQLLIAYMVGRTILLHYHLQHTPLRAQTHGHPRAAHGEPSLPLSTLCRYRSSLP